MNYSPAYVLIPSNHIQATVGVGNFTCQSRLHGSDSGCNSVKIQVGIWGYCSVPPNCTTPGGPTYMSLQLCSAAALSY